MVEHQGPRRRAACMIRVDGHDVTSKLNPYLISVQVIDSLEHGYDEAHLELDDRNAELRIPPDGRPLEVWLGWAGEGPRLPDDVWTKRNQIPAGTSESYAKGELPFGGPGMQLVFSGTVTEVESGFSRRGGGRRLWIKAESPNSKEAGKEVQNKSYGHGKKDDSEQSTPPAAGVSAGGGDIPLFDVFKDLAQKAGLQVKFSPKMMEVKRDFWHINESLHHLGQRMGMELGAFFKVANGTAMMVFKNEDVNVDGTTLETVEAVWGVNLIAWRIKPFSGRPQYSSAAGTFFDVHNAVHKVISSGIGGDIPFGAANAIARLINTSPNKEQAEQQNKGTSTDSEYRRGTGWVMINGDPRAKTPNKVHIQGARPGVDGTYNMTEVEHNYTRGVGYTTRINVQAPQLASGDYPDYPRTKKPDTPPPEQPPPERQELPPPEAGGMPMVPEESEEAIKDFPFSGGDNK